MTNSKHFFPTLCDVLILLGLLGLIVPPYSYGKNGSSQVRDDSPSQGDKHRADPCDHLPDPPGDANGIEKKCPSAGSSSGIAKGDFNGDGFGDLAVGVPFEDTGGAVDAGAVIVIYGSASGLTTTDLTRPASQFWSQNSPGVPGTSENDDHFGSALAAGDFNGDGFSDLAIGSEGEDIVIDTIFGVENFKNLGAVTVIYGSANGLTTTNPPVAAQFWDETDFDEFDQGRLVLAEEDEFGSALAWGDFNHDGVGDLAIGIPNKTLILEGFPLHQDIKGGAVAVLYGSQNNGLTRLGQQVWSQDGPIGGGAEDGDQFGAAVAAGDFNGDTFSDLAVGVPGEDVSNNSVNEAGAVSIIFGSSAGLTSTGNQFWSQASPNIRGSAEANDHFGKTLAAGDFNRDGRTDLAIGVPDEDLGSSSNAGAVNVIYGSAGGLSATAGPGNQFWAQDTLFGTGLEKDDHFGAALAVGDFDGNGRADLAIGVPFQDITVTRTDHFPGVGTIVTTSTLADAGEVNVIYGSTSAGLSTTAVHAPQKFQDGTPEAGAEFSRSLTVWNFGRNETRILPPDNFTVVIETADLAVGIPFKDVNGQKDAGAVNVMYGSSSFTGLTTSDSQIWTQDSSGVPGAAEDGDQFGRALY